MLLAAGALAARIKCYGLPFLGLARQRGKWKLLAVGNKFFSFPRFFSQRFCFCVPFFPETRSPYSSLRFCPNCKPFPRVSLKGESRLHYVCEASYFAPASVNVGAFTRQHTFVVQLATYKVAGTPWCPSHMVKFHRRYYHPMKYHFNYLVLLA